MASALSLDLRERVVAAIEAGASRREAALSHTKEVTMDFGAGLVVVGLLIWCVLKDIRDQLIAVRLRDDPTFFNVGWIRYRRLPGGAIETIGTDGFKSYKSETEFRKKTGRHLC